MNLLRRVLWIALLLARPLEAQYLTRPAIPWETIHTAHFDIHFPSEMRAWATDVASRVESATDAVSAMVGNRPSRRVTIMIEDPSNQANGFALPFLDGPVVFFWPTPPTPSPSFGAYSDWGEMLAVHEYGHIAHLTFPSRNARERLFWKLMPVSIGPVARKSPAWVIEGYATLIEGRLTGNGRPYGAGRPAVIREFAREGRLPTYGALDASSPFLGGAMRYLVGSAFLEWLEQRKGPESLNHVWRRMSARVSRSFDEAFAGVYGTSPADLYGRFVAEATAEAIAVERRLATSGLAEGELVQKLTWYTGEPAPSPSGDRVAVVLRSPRAPSRLVVWSMKHEPDTARARRRREMLARDPLDVPAFDSFPPPPRTVATLRGVNGRGHDFPRWFADGRRILVSREEPRGDGTTRPDLFVWDTKSGALSRITRGAGMRQADPSPDGRLVVGARCKAGVCDLVIVELATGDLRVLVHGSPEVTWQRPRWSPDGRRVAASVHQNGRWGVRVFQMAPYVDPNLFTLQPEVPPPNVGVSSAADSGRSVGPADGSERYSPEWTPDGRALVVVSEAGGIANLARVDLATNAETPLTREVGAAMAPAAARGDTLAYFLTLHSRGLDVRRISVNGPSVTPTLALDGDSSFVLPRRPAAPPSFERRAFDGPHPYGLGPRRWRALPAGAASADGAFLTLALANTDPVGRLGVLAQAAWGDASTWRGGSLLATSRAWPASIELGLFATEQRPSLRYGPPLAPSSLDARLAGGSAALAYDRDWLSSRFSAKLGASGARFQGVDARGAFDDASSRAFGFASVSAGALQGRGDSWVSGSLAGDAAAGATAGESWRRGRATLTLATRQGPLAVRASGTLGEVSYGGIPSSSASRFEDFAVGGIEPPLFDATLLSQRIALPAVPTGYASGRRVEVIRVSATRLPMLTLPLTPYMVWARTGGTLDGPWRRVIGAETVLDFESLAFASVPGVRVRGGVGYSLDEPFRKRARLYLSAAYRP